MLLFWQTAVCQPVNMHKSSWWTYCRAWCHVPHTTTCPRSKTHSFIHSFMFFVYLLFSMTECYHKFPKLQQAQTKIWFGGEVTHVLTSYRCCFHITWNSVPFELFYFCKCCYCYEASCCSFHSLIQKYGKISRGLMRTCCVNRHAVNISSNFLIRHYPCFAKLQLIWTPLECWTMW